jgi:hypothetical protein
MTDVVAMMTDAADTRTDEEAMMIDAWTIVAEEMTIEEETMTTDAVAMMTDDPNALKKDARMIETIVDPVPQSSASDRTRQREVPRMIKRWKRVNGQGARVQCERASLQPRPVKRARVPNVESVQTRPCLINLVMARRRITSDCDFDGYRCESMRINYGRITVEFFLPSCPLSSTYLRHPLTLHVL